jgi:hypothetical protein
MSIPIIGQPEIVQMHHVLSMKCPDCGAISLVSAGVPTLCRTDTCKLVFVVNLAPPGEIQWNVGIQRRP